jgi:hypothetical protein
MQRIQRRLLNFPPSLLGVFFSTTIKQALFTIRTNIICYGY